MKNKMICILCILLLMSIIVGCGKSSEIISEPLPPEQSLQTELRKTPTVSLPSDMENATDADDESVKEENEETLYSQEKEQRPGTSDVPQRSKKADEKLQETPQPVATGTQKPRQTQEPEIASKPAPIPSHTPSPTAKPKPTPTPEPEMEIMGSSFNNAVLTAINTARAEYGNAPMTLDNELCTKALAHAKEMAARGEIFHSCGGAESVSNAVGSGSSIGTRSAAHATGLALDADRSRLGVGSVKIGDKQYTCVFSPRD